jgi:hypothetical protein
VRGRPVPSWLRAEWKRIPEAPQQETIEARALFLMQAYRDREVWLKKKPNLLQALAFDLMSAAYENPTRRRWPDEIGWLMSLALGLPAEHEAGNWVDQLETRGSRDYEALYVARHINWSYTSSRCRSGTSRTVFQK